MSAGPDGGRGGGRRGPRRTRAQAGRRGFILTITDGRNAGREYFFAHEASLGRTDENNVVIIDPGVSRRHARVAGAEGVFTLEDLGSSNGTRLNGERLAGPEVLRDGDYVQIGETTILFSVLDVGRVEVTSRTSFAELERAHADRKFTAERQQWKVRLRQLLRRREVVAGLVGAGLLVLGLGGYALLRSGSTGIVLDRSSEVVPYSDDDEFFNRVFGYGDYDKTHREKAQIEFEYLGGRVTLQYGAWGVDKVGEVQILVNGHRIADTPLTMGRWVYGLKVLLPRELLRKGQPNLVVFKNSLNPPGKDRWEVCYVQVVQEAIPPPNREEARLQFELAKKAYEDREIAAGNLTTALQKFKKARDLLEELPDRPEIYAEAVEYIDKVDKALTRKFQDALFEAERAEKYQGTDAYRKVLRRGLTFFAKDDFRYREIKRRIDLIDGL